MGFPLSKIHSHQSDIGALPRENLTLLFFKSFKFQISIPNLILVLKAACCIQLFLNGDVIWLFAELEFLFSLLLYLVSSTVVPSIDGLLLPCSSTSKWSERAETAQCTYVCNNNTFSSFLETFHCNFWKNIPQICASLFLCLFIFFLLI